MIAFLRSFFTSYYFLLSILFAVAMLTDGHMLVTFMKLKWRVFFTFELKIDHGIEISSARLKSLLWIIFLHFLRSHFEVQLLQTIHLQNEFCAIIFFTYQTSLYLLLLSWKIMSGNILAKFCFTILRYFFVKCTLYMYILFNIELCVLLNIYIL